LAQSQDLKEHCQILFPEVFAMKIGIIGKGNVGTALGTGLTRKGHIVKYGHRDVKEPVDRAAEWGEVLILAVPHDSLENVTKDIGSAADGKVVLDVTNAVGNNWNLTVGFTTSLAEELQKMLPKARVVKAFNTVFAKNQSAGKIGKEQLTLFVAADDAEAKQTIMKLGGEIGFDPIDAGPLKSARYLEPMAMLLITLAFQLGMGVDIGFKLVKGRPKK
jgi:predicted dinucleotide-binding enzyme